MSERPEIDRQWRSTVDAHPDLQEFKLPIFDQLGLACSMPAPVKMVSCAREALDSTPAECKPEGIVVADQP
jgi:hypothetical protein